MDRTFYIIAVRGRLGLMHDIIATRFVQIGNPLGMKIDHYPIYALRAFRSRENAAKYCEDKQKEYGGLYGYRPIPITGSDEPLAFVD